MGAKSLPKSIKKSIPNHTCTKGPVGSYFSSNLVPLDPQKTAFRMRGVLKITCSPSSHFSSESLQKVTKTSQNGARNLPKTPSNIPPKNDPDFYGILLPFWPQKWSKMEPSGTLGGVLGALWEGMASHSAPKRLPRVPKGLPRYPQGLNFDLFWTCCWSSGLKFWCIFTNVC